MTESPKGDLSSDFLALSDAWIEAYPGAHAGVLAMRGVANPGESAPLRERRLELEESLRVRFSGNDRAALRTHPTLRAYAEYYKRFDKTYHVQLQLESIAFKGKSMPANAALVEAMFMAELDNLLLTAGHDMDALHGSLMLDVATGTESYILLRGTPQAPKPGDMMIRDGAGIISSIVYGPDRRTQIGPETTRAVFTVYAPAGIAPEAAVIHLTEIATLAKLVAPAARVDLLQVYPGD